MLIYVIVSCPQAHGIILDIYNETCIMINVILCRFLIML